VMERLDLSGRSYSERLLQYSNDILARNFRLGPWIHTASEIENWLLRERVISFRRVAAYWSDSIGRVMSSLWWT